jgi:hypothetical protein
LLDQVILSTQHTYLLETICNLELESSPELRDANLRGLLINLSGKAGAFATGDSVQEFFNRLIEAIVERKRVEFGAHFIWNIISRNLHHFACIKLDLHIGVGLAERSSRHKCPHMKPEVQTLLEEYCKTQLHQRRPGCAYDNVDTDNFRRGMNKLQNGKLAKWIIDTTTTQGLNTVTALPPLGVADEQDITSVEEYEVGEDEGSDDGVEQADYQSKISDSVTMGFMQMVNGELIIHTADFDEVDDLFTELEADAEEED